VVATVATNQSSGVLMSRSNSSTRGHILGVTETMLSKSESSGVRIADVAKLANVGVPTIYYYFESRDQLIAEAQASIYLKLIEPLHQFLAVAEDAIVERDQGACLTAIGDNLVMAWSFGQLDGGWKISKLLMDVWSDQTTQRTFCELLDAQMDRWIVAIESSKALGWLDEETDVIALITSCWTGSMGQAIFSKSTRLIYSPESIRDFFMKIVAVKAAQP
jgi:AcrR family transcriptional regulator